MENTTWVHTEPTLLSKTETYSIAGCLYQYLYKTTASGYSQYWFKPLPGQKKKATLKVSQKKVYQIVFVQEE
jgi:hypothetical protein